MGHDQNTIPFGLHLMLDMYHCDAAALNDKSLVENILNTLPEKLGMHKLTEPVVVYAEPNNIKDSGGYSGFVMIQESHISIHTFAKRGFVTIDVYSCTQFDTDACVNYFSQVFKTNEFEKIIEVRGKHYPAQDSE